MHRHRTSVIEARPHSLYAHPRQVMCILVWLYPFATVATQRISQATFSRGNCIDGVFSNTGSDSMEHFLFLTPSSAGMHNIFVTATDSVFSINFLIVRINTPPCPHPVFCTLHRIPDDLVVTLRQSIPTAMHHIRI